MPSLVVCRILCCFSDSLGIKLFGYFPINRHGSEKRIRFTCLVVFFGILKLSLKVSVFFGMVDNPSYLMVFSKSFISCIPSWLILSGGVELDSRMLEKLKVIFRSAC